MTGRAGELAELAAIALALVVAGGVMVAPDLSLDQRAAALASIVTGLVVVARIGRRGG